MTEPSMWGLQHRLYVQAARLTGLGAWECDLETEALTWTEGTYDLFGLPVGSRLTRASVLDLYCDESRNEVEAARAEALRTGQGFTLEARIRTIRGEYRWIRISACIGYDDERPVRLFGAKQNITAEKEAWVRLAQRADRDAVTGLANRAVFDMHYQRAVADTVNHGGVSALALIDLDHFKQINDGLGHATGDECLRMVGLRLKRVFKDAVLVARIGGDEFAILLRAPLGSARMAEMLQRALRELGEPIGLNDKRLVLGVSIGAAVLGDTRGRKPSELFSEADAALYAAKAAGRNTLRIFGQSEGDEPAAEEPWRRSA